MRGAFGLTINSPCMLLKRLSGISLRHSLIVAPSLSLNGKLGVSLLCRLSLSGSCLLFIISTTLVCLVYLLQTPLLFGKYIIFSAWMVLGEPLIECFSNDPPHSGGLISHPHHPPSRPTGSHLTRLPSPGQDSRQDTCPCSW